jgi:hypothetical protein
VCSLTSLLVTQQYDGRQPDQENENVKSNNLSAVTDSLPLFHGATCRQYHPLTWFDHSDRAADGWALDWRRVPTSAAAPPRTQHTTCYHAATHSAVLFGGYAPTQGCLNDVWAVDISTKEMWQPSDKGTYPGKRRGHVTEIVEDGMWVFGGTDASAMLGDVYHLCLKTWQWTQVCAVICSYACMAQRAYMLALQVPSSCPACFQGTPDTRIEE